MRAAASCDHAMINLPNPYDGTDSNSNGQHNVNHSKHGVLLHDAQFKVIYLFIHLFIHPMRRFSFKTLVKLVMLLKYLGSRSAAFLPQASQLVEMLINSSTVKPFMFCT
jgi:hypothetical protein